MPSTAARKYLPAQDPEFFGAEAMTRLQSSLGDGTFVQVLDSLMKDEKFRRKMFSLAPPSFSNGQ